MKIFYFIFLAYCCFAQGEIQKTGTLNPLWEKLTDMDSHTLVIFDVNEVLIVPQDMILRKKSKTLRSKLEEKYLNPLGEEKKLALQSKIYLKKNVYIPIDPCISSLIKQIKNRQAKAMALTAGKTGPFGLIPHFEDQRLVILREMGINFSDFPDTENLTFIDGHTFTSKAPIYTNGILHSRPYSKGQVLEAFLNRIPFHPKKILFVDNDLSNLESVEEIAKKRGISFLGLFYQGEESLPYQLDENIAEIQYQILRDKEQWLSDEEAKNCLIRR